MLISKSVDYALETTFSQPLSAKEWSNPNETQLLRKALTSAQSFFRERARREISIGEFSAIENQIHSRIGQKIASLKKLNLPARYSPDWWFSFWYSTGEILLPTAKGRRMYFIKHIAPDRIITLVDERKFKVEFLRSSEIKNVQLPTLVIPGGDLNVAHWVLPT